MKKVIILFLLVCCRNIIYAQPSTMWQLLTDGTIIKWAYAGGDEFNGNSLDDNKWLSSFKGSRNGSGPSTNLEYMADQNIVFGFNSSINSGTLRLTAIQEDISARGVDNEDNNFPLMDGSPNWQLWHYTSGMICSKQTFKYGLFEIRAKWPSGKGLFPAFWLYGGNPNEEFDIIEYKGETPNKYHIDLHCPNGCNNYSNFLWFTNPFGGWVTLNGDLSSSFNVIRGEWEHDASFFSINNSEFAIWLGNLNYQANLIANFSLSGPNSPFPGAVDNTTPFPSTFEIDYIRVWTRFDCENDFVLSNFVQTNTDITSRTGRNINVDNFSLVQNQSLKLIATESITVNSNTEIKGDFEGRIVDCPNISKSKMKDIGLLQTLNDTSKIGSDKDNVDKNVIQNHQKAILYTKIYPNPSYGSLTVEFEGEIDRPIKIDLFDSKGVTVYSKEIVSLNKLVIDVSFLNKGIYILKGTFGENSIIEKIIIQ
jgi:beta-glucanase (GH16 family)